MATEDRSLQMVPAAMVVEEDKALIEEENSEVEWKLQLDLPDDAYSAIMVIIVEALNGTFFSWTEKCLWVPQAIVHFAVLVFAQGALIIFLDKAVYGYDPCDVATDVLLQYIGVGAFVGETLQEVSAACTMLTVVWVSEDIRFGGRWFRVMLTMVFILPKMAMSLWLIIVGSHFVLTSATNMDLIMNCVALTFVNSMDDVMFNNLYHLYGDQHSKMGWSIYFQLRTVEVWSPVRLAFKTLTWAAFVAEAIWSEPEC